MVVYPWLLSCSVVMGNSGFVGAAAAVRLLLLDPAQAQVIPPLDISWHPVSGSFLDSLLPNQFNPVLRML
jgi:hypothetical protein